MGRRKKSPVNEWASELSDAEEEPRQRRSRSVSKDAEVSKVNNVTRSSSAKVKAKGEKPELAAEQNKAKNKDAKSNKNLERAVFSEDDQVIDMEVQNPEEFPSEDESAIEQSNNNSETSIDKDPESNTSDRRGKGKRNHKQVISSESESSAAESRSRKRRRNKKKKHKRSKYSEDTDSSSTSRSRSRTSRSHKRNRQLRKEV